MQFSLTSGAAVLLALAPTALSVGTARVVNNCGFDVYYANVIQNVAVAMQKLPSGGYSETYSLPNVGVSVKLAPSASQAPTQFEFTWSNGKINYDISNINGNPFQAWGMTLAPSMTGDSKNPTCQVVSCPAGEAVCAQAYNQPDDTRTMVCDQASDLTMTLCPNGSGGSSSSAARSVSSASAVSAAAAATTSAPAPVATTLTSAASASTSGWHGHNRYHARHLPTK